MKNVFLLMALCLIILAACTKQTTNPGTAKQLLNDSTSDCLLDRDTCVLISSNDGVDYYWKKIGWNYRLISQEKGGHSDSVEVKPFLPFAPLTCSVQDDGQILLKMGVDGQAYSLNEISGSDMFFSDNEWIVTGSPYSPEKMLSLQASVPPSIAGKHDTCPIQVKMNILTDTDERMLAPHIYRTFADKDSLPVSRPVTAYEAMTSAAKQWFSQLEEGDFLRVYDWYGIPVWHDRKSGATTMLYYTIMKPGMTFFFTLFYETVMPQKDRALSFDDIFMQYAEQKIREMLHQAIIDPLSNFGKQDIKANLAFALTRSGVAVSIRSMDLTDVPPVQLLKYKDIESLLRPEMKKLVSQADDGLSR